MAEVVVRLCGVQIKHLIYYKTTINYCINNNIVIAVYNTNFDGFSALSYE